MSGSGNGADMGQVLAILHELAAGQQEIRATLGEHGRVLNEHSRMLHEHSRMLHEHSREIKALTVDVSGLRQAVTEYHATVLGHGVLYSQLDDRVRRIERHLNLPPAA